MRISWDWLSADWVNADWVSAAAAIFSAVAAFGAWRTAAKAKTTSDRAAKAADDLTKIEQRRLQAENTPELRVFCADRGSSWVLVVALTGPNSIGKLDRVQISIRDDQIRTIPLHYPEFQRDEFKTVIWGPLRFIPGIDGAVDDRTSGAFELLLDEPRAFTMTDTQAPSWYSNPANWDTEQAGKPLRIRIRCEADGFDPWTIPLEVAIEFVRQPPSP